MLVRPAANLLSIVLKPRKALALPVYLHIEPTSRCHLSCIGCARDSVIKEGSDLALEDFKRIIDEVRPHYLALSGIGEPILHKDFFEMVRYARSRGVRVNTCSSMVLPEQAFEGFVTSGLDLLKISIDGASRETYQKLRGRDLFDKVLRGVESVQEAKRRLGRRRPVLRFNCLLVEDTISELEELVGLAERLGVEAVNFQPLERSNVEVRTQPLIASLDYERFLEVLVRANEKARSLEVATNLQDLINRFPVYWGMYRQDERVRADETRCPMPWYSLYLNASGVAQPCCKFSRYGMEHGALGNALDKGVKTVWSCEELQQLRMEFRRGERRHPICQECVAQGPFQMLTRLKMLPRFLRLRRT